MAVEHLLNRTLFNSWRLVWSLHYFLINSLFLLRTKLHRMRSPNYVCLNTITFLLTHFLIERTTADEKCDICRLYNVYLYQVCSGKYCVLERARLCVNICRELLLLPCGSRDCELPIYMHAWIRDIAMMTRRWWKKYLNIQPKSKLNKKRLIHWPEGSIVATLCVVNVYFR